MQGGSMLLSVLLLIVGALAEGTLVKTPAGTFKGIERFSQNGHKFSSFSGIPYAKPPIGNLRFKEPERIDPLKGEYDATHERDDCLQQNRGYHRYPMTEVMQKEYVGSEDCLYLNVHSPQVDSEAKLPVMVFIHGGAFFAGSGTEQLQGPEILMDRDIVLVIINYRLGVLGFFSFDGVIPGNLGLKDQTMALRWVKENIKAFGGNPDSITLFGVSAGGASVHQHMVSPLSKGLFHKGISQSGTADCFWVFGEKDVVKQYTHDFLNVIGCKPEKSTIKECLQEKDATNIITAATKLKTFPLDIVFRPVLEEDSDSAFVTKKSLDEGSSVPWIAGVTNSEGLGLVDQFVLEGDTELEKFKTSHKKLFPSMLQYSLRKDRDAITKKIKDFYVGEEDFSLKNIKALIMLIGDSWFNHGLLKSSLKHHAPLYHYLFSYRGDKSMGKLSFASSENDGASHGDDMFYLFHVKKFSPQLSFNDEEREVSRIMVDLWTSFARDGVPTSEGQPEWPNAKKSNKYALLSSKGLKIRKNLFDKRLQFWDQIIQTSSQMKDEL